MQASNRRRRHLASRKRQGILGSITAACTSEVLYNVPKRIGSGMPYPTKAWPVDHLWAMFLSGDCCGQQSQPFNQNIGRRIAVPVVVCPTHRTGPLPDREVFRIRVLVPAAAAQLATGEECANLNDLLVLPSRLILQLPAELAPGSICDGLGQGMVSHHPLNIEALYTDDVIVPDQLSGQFMEVVIPLIGYLLMQSGHLKTSLLPVPAALWFSGQLTLEFS